MNKLINSLHIFCTFWGMLFTLFSIGANEPQSPTKRPPQSVLTAPQTPIKKPRIDKNIVRSPHKVKMLTPNICRSCIDYIKNHDIEEFMNCLSDWHRQIPHSFFEVSWPIPQKARKHEKKYRLNFKKNLNLALFFQIFACIANANSPKSCHRTEVHKTTCINTRKKMFCQLTKLAKMSSPSAHYIFSLKNQVVLVTLPYIICCRVNTSSGEPKIYVEKVNDKYDSQLEYITHNIVKDALYEQLLIRGSSSQIENSLTTLLSWIPRHLLLHKEKFYHGILFGMIRFMGSSFSLTEQNAGIGRADLILKSQHERVVAEFKYKKPGKRAEDALQQIKDQRYGHWFSVKDKFIKAVGITIRDKPRLGVSCKKEILPITTPRLNSRSSTRFSFTL